MNSFTNTKKQKKFIITLVILILFSFGCPKSVKAFDTNDIIAAPARIFWMIERGLLTFLNNIFANEENKAVLYEEPDDNNYIVENLTIVLTPDNIIKGKFLLFDANIFRELTKENSQYYYDYEEGGDVYTGKVELRRMIAGWYYALRNFAIIALLSVLVYVGIRMILSTIAQDKAKYKVMFKDWLVALCLLVVMHYIMIGILNMTSIVVDAVGGGSGTDLLGTAIRDLTGVLSEESEDNDYEYKSESGETLTLSDAYAKVVVIGGVLIYTFIFAIKYLKREFTIIFLILLGPVSCITYPIDKISDGKAQAFNRWFSEFLYQVIVQPFHLLLYIVLIGTASQLAETNVLYALVCFAIMGPAEKFVKEMFGFKDKLGSPLGGFVGGALASKMLSSIRGGGDKQGKGGNGGGESDDSSDLPTKSTEEPQYKGEEENSDQDGNTSGASAAGAFQDSEDPKRDAEREALEEKIADGQIDESELTDEQKELLGKNENKNEDENENEKSSLAKRFGKKVVGAMGTAMSVHNQRAAKKWGSTSRTQRWLNRGKSLLKRTAGLAFKTAAVGAGAATLGVVGLAAGQGAKGAMLGAALGGSLAKKTIKGASGFYKGAKDYGRAYLRDGDRGTRFSKENAAFNRFSSDPKQIERAAKALKKKNGREPTRKELHQEMKDRFDLSRYGLKGEQLDRAVASFQKHCPTDKINDTATRNDELRKTAFAAKLSDDYGYKGKDFMSGRTMQEAREGLAKRFTDKGVPQGTAQKNAEDYLRRAAEINGSNITFGNKK